MDLRPFVELVRDLLGAMGQELDAARPVPEGLALRTQDDYLYVFVADPSRGSMDSVRRWCVEADVPTERLVVFSLRSLPASWGPEVTRRGGTVVAGGPFERLVRDLGIESPLLAPEGPGRPRGASALPSVRGLESEMQRADTWYSSGVLALSARFYSQAVALKPEFVPALVGLARSRAGLGEWAAALDAWDRLLELSPGTPEARLGRAVALGSLARRAEELRELRELTRDLPDWTEARVALFASLAERGEWTAAGVELDRLLDRNPSDPRLRYLHAELLGRKGLRVAADDERAAARRLGLTEEEAGRLERMLRVLPPADE